MTRRLVELDQFSYATEVDKKRLRREAQELKDYLSKLAPADDTQNLRRLVMPFCEKALDGTLPLPLDVRKKPINIPRVLDAGGKVPERFEELYARFFNTAVGARADVENRVERGGKSYAWVDFED